MDKGPRLASGARVGVGAPAPGTPGSAGAVGGRCRQKGEREQSRGAGCVGTALEEVVTERRPEAASRAGGGGDAGASRCRGRCWRFRCRAGSGPEWEQELWAGVARVGPGEVMWGVCKVSQERGESSQGFVQCVEEWHMT